MNVVSSHSAFSKLSQLMRFSQMSREGNCSHSGPALVISLQCSAVVTCTAESVYLGGGLWLVKTEPSYPPHTCPIGSHCGRITHVSRVSRFCLLHRHGFGAVTKFSFDKMFFMYFFFKFYQVSMSLTQSLLSLSPRAFTRWQLLSNFKCFISLIFDRQNSILAA